MKKLIPYLFLVLHLVAYPEARELMKLPLLVEHFISHEIKNPDTTVFSFIQMHYLGTPIKDADYKEDMKLPFKVHDCSFTAFNLQIPPKTLEISFGSSKIFSEKNQNFSYFDHFTTQYLSSVFRPPILV